MSELLWLEPTTGGNLPPGSLFFASRGFVVSTFVLGTFDVEKRQGAYKRVVKALLWRARTHSHRDVQVKHSSLSQELVGSTYSICSQSTPPHNLTLAASFADILADEEALKGELAPEDKLKLIFQAVYGGAHILSDISRAKINFTEEWDSLKQANDEPLAERISPEGDLYRINLRPAKELGISPEALFEAVRHSARLISNDRERRKEKILVQSHLVGIEPHQIATETYHHSVSYGVRNHPAYRLLHLSEISRLLRLTC